jgi:Short C-terminal domain
MPGLLRGVARTAVVAGTATAVRGRVARRQAERFADRDARIYADRTQAYENERYERQQHEQPMHEQQAPPPAPSQDDIITQLKQLGELREQGVLTDQEFAAQKARILNG